MTEHINYVTTINSLNAISYLCTIIKTMHPVRLLHLVHGWTCEFCLIHQLDSLDNPFGLFACQTCLGYESEVNLIQVCDLKRRPFLSQWRFWSPIFGQMNTTFLLVRDEILFCWISNCEYSNGELIGPCSPGWAWMKL